METRLLRKIPASTWISSSPRYHRRCERSDPGRMGSQPWRQVGTRFFFSPFLGPFGGLGAFLGVHGAEESQRIPPGAESLGAGGTQAVRGWRAAPAPAPTRQMASLSPCDSFFFLLLLLFLFNFLAVISVHGPPLPPFPLPCPLATFPWEERSGQRGEHQVFAGINTSPIGTAPSNTLKG